MLLLSSPFTLVIVSHLGAIKVAGKFHDYALLPVRWPANVDLPRPPVQTIYCGPWDKFPTECQADCASQHERSYNYGYRDFHTGQHAKAQCLQLGM